jgi:hypothetical protein
MAVNIFPQPTRRIVEFNSSGAFVCPANVYVVDVFAVGGGGGSGYLDLTRGTLITATAGGNGVASNFSYPNISSANYANNAGRGGKAYTNTADNSGGNGLVTIHWKSSTPDLTIADNTGNLVRTGYTFFGWNTAAIGTGTRYNVLTPVAPS